MIIVIGYSDKLDGVCFIADTNDHATALTMMRDAWNAQFTDQMKLVTVDAGNYLIKAEVDAECVHDFEGEAPRREGFILYMFRVPEGGIIQNMPW